MSLLSDFYLNSPSSIKQYDLLEISHPSFSTTHRLVRNAPKGISVTHEGPAGPFAYTYLPMRIKPIGASNDLTQSLAVTFGDVGQIIQNEIRLMTIANTMNTRPVVKFRCYRSDDLTLPIHGPFVLEISTITTAEDGTTLEAHAPRLNNSRTGQVYDLDRFPMLRGFF